MRMPESTPKVEDVWQCPNVDVQKVYIHPPGQIFRSYPCSCYVDSSKTIVQQIIANPPGQPHVDYLRNEIQVGAFDVEVNGGAQFRRLMTEVDPQCTQC